ncbi:N-acetyl-gamma-glutamyl-phosphate reductase [Prodigiosinella confusarubida]|uniref:N-acetyl-gamma-glutamyl-phosphate reductase n=1 Tax=Serratia sp. (strain ATCC 39006) TaxID=104623 RepID=A0A2I5TIB0_SERS3|nr:N-acetyl-gamma-glutamyl-phosphate reductase [Serratia sp. ATCC 39006]AUG99980.1 N-acetyl-gamma-glutamyl-phosphate reductase [Serratia sp. ATCC 39006]AUH04300.1 N-acetyl-gamma-glutamyl-phosphate reductase [Serratia sp. ATCC 39006]
MNKIITAAILGGSGFVGSELYRILSMHPQIEVRFLSSESQKGLFVERQHKSFRFHNHNSALKFSSLSQLEEHYDIIFSCLPNGRLPEIVSRISKHCTRLFNLSGDYRFQEENINKVFYPATSGSLPEGIVTQYFIPEFTEVEHSANIINLPGCMAVAAIYALYPLVRNGLVAGDIVIDAKTGSSGAGKSTSETHAERSNNFRMHKAFNHRHAPEIAKLKYLALDELEITFASFSLDTPRGIYISAYSTLKNDCTENEVRKAYFSHYQETSFVHYLKSGQIPMLKTVCGTNHVEVATFVHANKCISLCSLDNLIKGAAGQAVQAANIYLGLEAVSGLVQLNEAGWP